MKKRLRMSVQWLPRKLPYFGIGFDLGEFRLYLWIVEIEIWKSYG